ncbi:hypothetical protein RIVM261_085720 [Rivularia sp. IAM M-261]|nr:hypothetical protein RIVM261_085720 [Rivularia sp. IAM M-261]
MATDVTHVTHVMLRHEASVLLVMLRHEASILLVMLRHEASILLVMLRHVNAVFPEGRVAFILQVTNYRNRSIK